MNVARRLGTMPFGGDYNPEQWPRDVWDEDVRLMAEAGVTMVTVGVFSWAMLEPEPDRFEFGWLDEALDLLHRHGVAVDLATATASPPPWLAHRWPQTRLVDEAGTVRWPGGRQNYCPSSPVYRERAVGLARRMVERYAGHPAVALWHVGNEYGGHNARCYCDVSAAAFRRWLRDRHGTLDGLNEAWGTAFWSQRYGDWEEVNPPRLTPFRTRPNPTSVLDFHRFCSDELLACFLLERDVVTAGAPDTPVTTNFMVMHHFDKLDYWEWSRHVDVVANDHYVEAFDEQPFYDLAFQADLTRGFARGRPWLLMEHSTSAVNWQPRNVAKAPGQMRRDTLTHMARGADGLLFFQWRQSLVGSEKFHSGLVPHTGPRGRVWDEVVALGRDVAALAPLIGSTVRGDVAFVWDYHSWWATQTGNQPTVDLDYPDMARVLHRALVDRGVTVDFVAPDESLDDRRLIVLPTTYVLEQATARRLADAVRAGATLLVTYFSGIADRDDHVVPGGYPALLQDLLGLRVDEFTPLRAGQRVGTDAGWHGDVWAEDVVVADAEVVARFTDGPVAGGPVLTRRPHGAGAAWYLATRPDLAGAGQVLAPLLDEVGVDGIPGPAAVQRVRRSSSTGSWLTLVNHTDDAVRLDVRGRDLLTGVVADGDLLLPAGAVAVIAEG